MEKFIPNLGFVNVATEQYTNLAYKTVNIMDFSPADNGECSLAWTRRVTSDGTSNSSLT